MEGNKPFEKIRISNGVEIAFWKKEIMKGEQKIEILEVTLSKSWKKDDKWENRSISMNLNDLYRLISVGSKIKEVEDKFREGKKIPEEEDIVM